MQNEISMAKGSSYYICKKALLWPPGWLKHVANFNFWTNKQVVRTAFNGVLLFILFSTQTGSGSISIVITSHRP
jgi:hypothetical protein